MDIFITIIVCLFAGLGAGFGTGFAGMSAAAVIAPMLVTFLNVDPYMAVGIALASDVLASAISAITFGKNKNLDIKNGIVMMITVLLFTFIGSYVANLVPRNTMGNFSMFMTIFLGLRFIIRPITNNKNKENEKSLKKQILQSIICGSIVGFICGFIGAGGGLMMLFILTTILGYELKTAVGTSVFIMTFTALTGSVSHFIIGGLPNYYILFLCMFFTLIFARIAAIIANKVSQIILNRLTGIILVLLGITLLFFKLI